MVRVRVLSSASGRPGQFTLANEITGGMVRLRSVVVEAIAGSALAGVRLRK
jgi:hypothetical protein